MSDYGKYGAAVKVFPSTAAFHMEDEKPAITYRFLVEEAYDYRITFVCAPTNSAVNHRSINFMLEVHAPGSDDHADSIIKVAELLPADFRAGEGSDARWATGVLNQERRCSVVLPLSRGVQELTIGALEPGFVLEKIMIQRASELLPVSYLGPGESYMVR